MLLVCPWICCSEMLNTILKTQWFSYNLTFGPLVKCSVNNVHIRRAFLLMPSTNLSHYVCPSHKNTNVLGTILWILYLTLFRYAAKHKIWRKHNMMCLHVQLPVNEEANHIYMECERKGEKAKFPLQRTGLMNQVLLLCYGRIINK